MLLFLDFVAMLLFFVVVFKGGGRGKGRKRGMETGRQTDRQTDRHADRQIKTQLYSQKKCLSPVWCAFMNLFNSPPPPPHHNHHHRHQSFRWRQTVLQRHLRWLQRLCEAGTPSLSSQPRADHGDGPSMCVEMGGKRELITRSSISSDTRDAALYAHLLSGRNTGFLPGTFWARGE